MAVRKTGKKTAKRAARKTATKTAKRAARKTATKTAKRAAKKTAKRAAKKTAKTTVKTVPTTSSVTAFLDRVADPDRRADCETVAALMERVTGEPATMWGASIVGFGRYHYRYASGRSGDWMLVGFSPRKRNLTLYVMPNLDGREAHLARLGPHGTGVGCLYVKRLADVDLTVLEALLTEAVAGLEPQRVRT